MTPGTARPTARRRWIVLAAGFATICSLLAVGVNPIVHAVTGHTIGELMAERDGHIAFSRYDRSDEVPAGVLPPWFPRDATAIAVARPGPKAGETAAIRIDAVVRAGIAMPTVCKPSSIRSIPFTVPNDWPTFGLRDRRTCDGWTLAARSGHWYLWTEQASISAAN